MKDGAETTKAVFCSFENNLGETVSIFVKNVTDPVSEFWENKALQQSAGVNDLILRLKKTHHVLFVHTLGSKSHLIQMAPLVQELAERGHQVTGIFFNTLKIEHENYKEIVVQLLCYVSFLCPLRSFLF